MTANNQERKSRPTGEPGGAGKGVQKSLCGASMPQNRTAGKVLAAANPLELLARAAEALTAAGLTNFEPLDASGALVKCGTSKKPHGTDGRYIIHLDDRPRVWFCNYHEGGEGQVVKLYEPAEIERLSPAEKAARRERVAKEKAAALEAREKAKKATAQRAGKLLEAMPPAEADNAYLKLKDVPPMPGLRQDEDGLLVVPVLDASGKLASLQRINADGGKRFLKGPLPRVYYFPIPAKDGSKTGPLLIAEGLATAASLYLATGHACLVAFSAGNLEAVARMAREKYPKRSLVLCADFDDQSPAFPEPGGKGVALARKAAAATGARLAICPSIDGAKADFNDLHQRRDLVAVQRAVEAALEIEPETMPENPPQEAWSEPVPFAAQALPVLDVAVLPPILGDFCAALAEEKQVPVELAAAMSLAALATAAQGRFMVHIREGYEEPLNLYTLCPLDPANRKSAVVEACLAPLREWERRIAESMAPEVKRAKSARQTMEKAIDTARARAAKCKSFEQIQEVQQEVEALEDRLPEVPSIPRLLADNITPEALAPLMEANGGCASILTAEGGIFDILGGMYYGGVTNLDLFLKAHSADSFRVDRRHAAPVLLDRPRLTVGISPQPVTLSQRDAARIFRGRGLDARFIYLTPQSLLGRRKQEPTPMPAAVRERFHNALLNLLPRQWEAEPPAPVRLELSQDAYRLWLEFSAGVEKELAPGGEFEFMSDWAGKLPGAVARLAGLFHLIDLERPADARISRDTMLRAVDLGGFLSEHAKAAYALMGTDTRLEGGKRVLEWIRRQAVDKFSARDCFNGVRGQTSVFSHMEDVRAALDELEERGFIRTLPPEQAAGPGRKPSPRYEVNPTTLRG